MKINKILILYNSQSYSQASPKEAVVELQSILSKKAKDVGMTIGQIDVEDLNDPDIIGAIENVFIMLMLFNPAYVFSENDHSKNEPSQANCDLRRSY